MMFSLNITLFSMTNPEHFPSLAEREHTPESTDLQNIRKLMAQKTEEWYESHFGAAETPKGIGDWMNAVMKLKPTDMNLVVFMDIALETHNTVLEQLFLSPKDPEAARARFPKYFGTEK